MKKINSTATFIISIFIFSITVNAQIPLSAVSSSKPEKVLNESGPVAEFKFNGNTNNFSGASATFAGKASFVKGMDGKALSLSSNGPLSFLTLDNKNLQFDTKKDFSVQFWIKTTMDSNKAAVILSQKDFPDNSLASQKNAGWVLYFYRGTWAWDIGSGKRRVAQERDNGKYQPLNDGKWHQLTMTYDSKNYAIRLFYDGDNKVLYNISDSVGFNFVSDRPIIVGSEKTEMTDPEISPDIIKGAENLQELVNQFNLLGAGKVAPNEFEDLIVDAKRFFRHKVNEMKLMKGADSAQFMEAMKSVDLVPVTKAASVLMRSPCTVHQVKDFMTVAPLLKIYSLLDGKVVINQETAKAYTEKEKLSRPDFDMDNLSVWNRTLSPQEVLKSYSKYFKPEIPQLKQKLSTLTAAEFNIHHGGIHLTVKKDGIDGRVQIANIFKKEGADVIMMSETYSNGDFIAAQLGYYFATTIDWDYLDQGANISVMSRYPIKEIYVPKGAPFMNVAVKVAISKTQDMYVMANWYGMNEFSNVFNFHKKRFEQSDSIPTLFAGDFNAVPNTDGGKNPASVKLEETGFTDAYRSLYPEVKMYPGYTHQSGHRIDQLYYKGKGLKNTSTTIISSWPGGWPSDHFMTIAKFDLDYSTR